MVMLAYNFDTVTDFEASCNPLQETYSQYNLLVQASTMYNLFGTLETFWIRIEKRISI